MSGAVDSVSGRILVASTCQIYMGGKNLKWPSPFIHHSPCNLNHLNCILTNEKKLLSINVLCCIFHVDIQSNLVNFREVAKLI